MNKENELSRRDLLKLGVAAAGAGLAGWSSYHIARKTGLISPDRELSEEDLLEFYRIEKEVLETKTPTPTNVEPTRTGEMSPTPEPSPTPEKKDWTLFGGEIDFLDPSRPIEMLVELNNGEKLWIPPFRAYNNESLKTFEYNTEVRDIDGKKIFVPGDHTVVAQKTFYPLNQKFIRFFHLWMHTGQFGGQNLELTELQNLIEKEQGWENNPGFTRTPEEAEKVIQELVIGAKVIVKQKDRGIVAKLLGAARIPPSEVDNYMLEVDKRIDFLKKRYPNSGFNMLEAYNEAVGLWGCGRKLGKETEFKNRPKARQSRIAFAIVPIAS